MKCYLRYLTSLKKGDALLPQQPEPARRALVPWGKAGHGHISKEGVRLPPGLERGRKGKKERERGRNKRGGGRRGRENTGRMGESGRESGASTEARRASRWAG